MRRPFVFAAFAALVAPSAALAHGTIPTANAIMFMPDGSLLLGTNFGAIHRGAADTFICETSVSGTQQAMDFWRALPDGRIAAAVLGDDFLRGVFLSDESACTFELVEGTGDLGVAQVTVDGDTLYLAGTRPDACSGCPDIGAVGVLTAEGLRSVATSALPATGVVVAGGPLSFFSAPGQAEVVGPDGKVTPTIPEGSTLHPLGAAGGAIYAVLRGDQGDEVAVSRDAGATFSGLGVVRGRIYGFAANAEQVWFQSPQLGVLTVSGDALVEIPFSPHGTCLAWQDNALWACGVPWQDGFVVGKSSDGEDFETVMPFFDGIASARACGAELTATCNEELDFLRGYYGFSTIVVPNPEVEPGPEVVEASEPNPEVAEGGRPPEDGGCGAGPGLAPLGLVALLRRRGR